jgi:predicted Rossmann-fold nucleotide-binding protein
MIALAHHFVVLPGGLGTIEEWLTTLSHFTATADYGHRIVVTNPDGIYDHMSQQILATGQSPMAHGRPLDIVRYVTTAEQLLAELQELS